MKCELCGEKSEVDFTMPLPMGILRSDLCFNHSFTIHDDRKSVENIIRNRAKKRNIKLPASLEVMAKLLRTKPTKKEVK